MIALLFALASLNSTNTCIIKLVRIRNGRSPHRSAYGIQLSALPEGISRRLPRYPLIPATLLGRLAVSSAHQGQKLGRFLLTDALHRSWRNTTEVASVGVVVDALEESARAFCLHHEFIPLLDHPNRLFLAMATIEKAFKAR